MYRRNSMATASLMLGILALFSGTILFIAVPLAALSVLCAILSKTDRKMPGKSIAGILIGIFAVIMSSLLTVQSFHYVMSHPEIRSYYSQIFEILLDEYGLPQEYNPFGDGTRDRSDDEESRSERLPNKENDSHSDTDDYFNSLYDDYFRYFHGADPHHGESPSPTPQNPSSGTSGGDFI